MIDPGCNVDFLNSSLSTSPDAVRGIEAKSLAQIGGGGIFPGRTMSSPERRRRGTWSASYLSGRSFPGCGFPG
jgi:hypothetical protein